MENALINALSGLGFSSESLVMFVLIGMNLKYQIAKHLNFDIFETCFHNDFLIYLDTFFQHQQTARNNTASGISSVSCSLVI
ncbi:hypothetical protein DLH98_09060 [Vibrio parahaemolyticus]|nr:hypothetical protein [Vibrio parahaemolyticus]EGR2945507.1 hypothetical protein [Vibrio parahaemolyticus]